MQVLGPVDHVAVDQDESSKQNDSSLVIMVKVARPTAAAHRRRRTARPAGDSGTGADLRADVLKIPHHGSAQQDPAFFAATHARLAIASAGRRQRLRSSGAAYGATRPVGWNDPAPDRSARLDRGAAGSRGDWLPSPNDDHACRAHGIRTPPPGTEWPAQRGTGPHRDRRGLPDPWEPFGKRAERLGQLQPRQRRAEAVVDAAGEGEVLDRGLG